MQEQQHQEMFEVETTHWWFVGKRLLFRRLLGQRLDPANRASSRILDVGCGTGAVATDFGRYGSVVATDFSPAALALARRRGVSEAVAADATALPFADNSFDLVTAFDILEHVADDRAMVAELARVLRPGGTVAIHVPAWPSMWSRHDEILEHKRRYTRRGLRALLASSPLEIERVGWSSCVILPVAAAVRALRNVTGNESETADLGTVPPLLNRIMLGVYHAEAAAAATCGLPFGLSLAAIAVKPRKSLS
ncbi:MAG: SAM-dependent methyltransferase [Hyphomicrobiaceae bacterium]|jgi:SAM-dependent methyltransferase